MKKVGEILKQERKKRKLTLKQASQATHIRQPILLAIEEGQHNNLPNPTFTQGLIINYAAFLGLNQKEILAFFRREYGNLNSRLQPKKPVPSAAFPLLPPQNSFFTLSPNYILYSLVGLVFLLALAFLGYQYLHYSRQPNIIVTNPQNETVSTRPTLTVSGRTDSENTVSINGQSAEISEEGFFNLNLVLDSGVQKIEIVAKNPYGRSTTIERVVKVEETSPGK